MITEGGVSSQWTGARVLGGSLGSWDGVGKVAPIG
jgi:hypothetical protein